MKKILAFLLAATMLCAMFVLPSSAESCKNATLDAEYNKSAPDIDGKVEEGEYSVYPALTYSENTDEFTQDDDHDDYNDWDFEFYISWNADALSMAWVVKSDVHAPFKKATYDDGGNIISDAWPEDGSMLGHMWQYSCVQFIITPSAPEAGKTSFQTGDYSGNYLEVGLTQLDDGDIGRVAWNYPTGVSSSDISINDWDAAIVRDEAAKTTTYEVSIPWAMSGIADPANESSFGLTFAVAAQEHYTNVRKGMIEWNDAILGGKKADNAGVITLTGGDDGVSIDAGSAPEFLVPGEVPADAEGMESFPITYVNKELGAEQNALQLDPSMPINSKWAYNLLLAPVEGQENVYSVVSALQGAGEEVTFDDLYEDGMVILAIHSDGGENLARKEMAMALPVGTELTVWGVDFDNQKLQYSNAMVYFAAPEHETESSDDISDETSDVSSGDISDETSAVSSDVESTVESTEESKAPAADDSSAADDESGSTVIIIVVVVVVLVAAAAVVVVILKKKKA